MLTTRPTASTPLTAMVARAACLCALAGSLVLASTAPSEAAFPGRDGRIALYRERPPGSFINEIHTLEPNGSHARRLTKRGSNSDGAYAPNGKTIAFTSNRDGDPEIFKMRAGGTRQRRLTRNQEPDLDPAWSPDGQRIAFTRNHLGDTELYTMRADGRKVRRRTNLDANTFGATWSPNGKRIAFYSSGDGDFEVYTLKLANNHVRQLTDNSVFDGEPDYSPSGNKIVFGTAAGIFRMNADGTSPRPITDNPADFGPIYAPSGDRIAFSRTIGGTSEVLTIRADGKKRRRLTRNAFNDIVSGWQPLRRHHR